MAEHKPVAIAPFSYGQREKEANDSFVSLVRDASDAMRSRYIDDRNVYIYKHGVDWASSKSPDQSYTRMYTIEAEYLIKAADIVDHKLSIIDANVTSIASQFTSQFAKNFYQTINEVTEQTGNIVDATGSGDLEAGIRLALEQVEWGVDRYGRATPPQLHVGPEVGEKLRKLIESGKGEVDEGMYVLNKNKETQALAREADRISRYRYLR